MTDSEPCSPANLCPARNEAHVLLWGECFHAYEPALVVHFADGHVEEVMDPGGPQQALVDHAASVVRELASAHGPPVRVVPFGGRFEMVAPEEADRARERGEQVVNVAGLSFDEAMERIGLGRTDA